MAAIVGISHLPQGLKHIIQLRFVRLPPTGYGPTPPVESLNHLSASGDCGDSVESASSTCRIKDMQPVRLDHHHLLSQTWRTSAESSQYQMWCSSPWRIRMESRLQSAELFDHVSGPVPPQPSQDWSKRDLKVRDFLIRHLPNHLILEISRCVSAASVWQLLNGMYGQQEATDRCKLKHEWHSLKLKSGESLWKFRNRVKEVARRREIAGIPVPED